MFSTSLEGLLFKAAKTQSPKVFQETIEEMKVLNEDAGKYVEKIEKEKWARAFFPGRRFGHVTSNISESMNWWLDDARHLHPVGLFCFYVRKLNKLFEKRHDKYASQPSTSLPKKVQELFSKSVEESRTLRVVRHTRRIFEVQRLNDANSMRIVDLENGTCTCGFSNEFGVPCRHLCAATLFLKKNPQKFIILERRLDALITMYSGVTIPVDSTHLRNNGLKPPTMTKRRGRPKKNRYVSSTEKPPKKTVTCSRSHKRGHNSRTCKVDNWLLVFS